MVDLPDPPFSLPNTTTCAEPDCPCAACSNIFFPFDWVKAAKIEKKIWFVYSARWIHPCVGSSHSAVFATRTFFVHTARRIRANVRNVVIFDPALRLHSLVHFRFAPKSDLERTPLYHRASRPRGEKLVAGRSLKSGAGFGAASAGCACLRPVNAGR